MKKGNDTMKKNITTRAHNEELVFVIDKSGSMAGLEADTVGGYNSVLERNRDGEGGCWVTCVLFDTEYEVVHDRVPIDRVRPLAKHDYRPGGCTALLDAVGRTIERVELVQRHLPAGYAPDHTTFAIITDGEENASRDFTYAKVKKLIEAKEREGWEFLFLGANIDVAANAASMGIRPSMAVSYSADQTGTWAAFDSFSEAVTQARSCGSVDETWAAATRADEASRHGGARHDGHGSKGGHGHRNGAGSGRGFFGRR